MTNRIAIAKTPQEISDCYPVMSELRPHLLEDDFVSLVNRLAEIAGFQLAYLYDGEIKAVAGFRLSEWLAGGKYLEIEDLVSKNSERSKGYGSELFDWLVNYAKANDCDHLRLVSRTTRADAHRFYLRKGMSIEAYYFSIKLK
jgi:GNAT superfamily N-acetyltransferase